MRSISKLAIAILVLSTAADAGALGRARALQEPPRPPAADLAAERHAAAVEALEAIAADAARLDDAVMRIRIYAEVGEALWDARPKLARALCERAAADYAALELAPDRAGVDNAHRRMLLDRATGWMGRDPGFAREVALNLKGRPAPIPGYARRFVSTRTELLLKVARHQLVSDPSAAADIVRMTFESGVAFDVVDVLEGIAARDRKLADAVARDLVASVLARGGTLYELGVLQPYVFEHDASVLPGERDEGERTSGAVDRALAAEFLEAVWAVADRYMAAAERWVAARKAGQTPEVTPEMTHGWAVSYYSHMRGYGAAFERYHPERAPAMRAFAERLGSLVETAAREQADLFLDPPPAADLAIRADQEADARRREHLLHQALARAERAGRFEEAIEIASKMTDEQNRRSSLSWLRRQMAYVAASEGRLDEAERVARDVELLDDRVEALLAVAERRAKTEGAEEAWARLDALADEVGRDRSASAYRAAISHRAIAETAARLDAKRGLPYLRAAVRAINAAETAPVERPYDMLFRGPFKSSQFFNRVDLTFFLSTYARASFDETLEAARSLADRGYSLLCQAEIQRTRLSR